MKIKEILNMKNEEFEKIMTEEEYNRMQELGIDYSWELLNAMQDGARESGLDKEEEYVTITTYLDYLEDMKA